MSRLSNRNKFLKKRLLQHQAKTKSSKKNLANIGERSDKDKVTKKAKNAANVNEFRGSNNAKIKVAIEKKKRRRFDISEISREATAGGVIYRINEGDLEILLVADHFDRWTIPKGHIEPGETARETAIREIGEEAGVHHLDAICWLGKIHFRYRRENVLVLMSTQIYLFKALGDTNDIQKEDWMNGIKWFKYKEAVSIVAYKDIAKLMRLGYKRLKEKGEVK